MRTKLRTSILLPLLSFAALLLAVELVVRLTLPHYPSRNFFLTLFGDPPDGTPEANKPLFAGDPVTFWRLRPNVDHTIWDFTVVSTNGQGLRYPRDLGKKPAGTFRIVCVGDSVTFGYRIPLVFPNDPETYDRNDVPYAGRLERMLAAEFPGREVEVIALAVPGYSSHQGLLALEQNIDWLDPDVVVICFGFNDVTDKFVPDKQMISRDLGPRTLRRVMSSSQALLHLWNWWVSTADPAQARAHLKGRKPGPRVALSDYVGNIGKMVQLAREHGAEVLVVGSVYRDRTFNPPEAMRMDLYRKTLRGRMRTKDIPYLQIDELTEAGAPDNTPLFGEHIHPSSLGHQMMAERILQTLRDQGALRELADRDASF